MLLHRTTRAFILLTVLAAVGCASPPASVASVAGRAWTTVQGGTDTLQGMMGKTATVFITLDPECPFCQLYTQTFQGIAERYGPKGLKVVGLYPGRFMERGEAAAFSRDAGFSFPQVMDNDCTLAKALQARVTPECFLTDAQGTVVYRGAVDDRAVRQGRKKYKAKKHYLADAIDGFLATGKAQPEVKAVGCIVEYGGEK